jgi:hypothetical protein
VITGPEDGAAAGRGHLKAAHADREHVIDLLKAAFVQDRLTKDELDARTGQALTARTYAELGTLTADIPAEPPAAGAPAARPQNQPERTHPVRNAAIGSASCRRDQGRAARPPQYIGTAGARHQPQTPV